MPSTTPAAPCPDAFLYGQDPRVAVPLLCGLDAVDTGLSGSGAGAGVRRPWPWPTSWRIPLAWRLRWHVAAYFHQLPRGGAGHPRAGGGSHSPLDRAGISVLVGNGERSCGAGRWPSRDRQRRAWRRSARGWLPGRPQGQRSHGHIILRLLAEAYGESRAGGGRTDDAGRSAGTGAQHWRTLLRGRAVSAERRVTAAAETHGAATRRKPVFARPSTWPAANRPNPWSCEPL